MKFCICFFGVIGRSLKKTIRNIEENIFNILKDNNIEYDVFIHNNYVETITNPRGKEYNCKIDNVAYKLLHPKVFSETNQNEFDKQYNWNLLFKNGDIFQNHFSNENISTKNAIRELHSLKMVSSLWKKEDYDFFLYLRPDLLYINKLNIDIILKNIHKKNVLFNPTWGRYLNGLNDRIYFGDYEAISKVANRIDLIPELIFKTKRLYHAETFLMDIVKKYGITVIDIDLVGERVRANGIILK